MRPQSASVAQGFLPAHPMLGTSKGPGERPARPGGWASLSRVHVCRHPPLSPHTNTLESEQGTWVVEFASTGSHGLGSFSGSLSLDALLVWSST